MTNKSELNENWYNKTHCSTLFCAEIYFKLVLIWKSYTQSKRVHFHEKPEKLWHLKNAKLRVKTKRKFFLIYTDKIAIIRAFKWAITRHDWMSWWIYMTETNRVILDASPCTCTSHFCDVMYGRIIIWSSIHPASAFYLI